MHYRPTLAPRRGALPTIHTMPASADVGQGQPDLPVLDGLPVHVSCEAGHVYRGTVHWFAFPSLELFFEGPGLIVVTAPGANCHHEGLVTPPACPSCAARPVHVHPCGAFVGGVE